MTRQQKVAEFLDEMHKYKRPHWCSGSVCACMGCVNKTGGAAAWKEKFPDEPPITKEEVDKYLENYPLPDDISFSIGTYKSIQE